MSHSRPSCFLHIPKAGGSTVLAALRASFSPGRVYQAAPPPAAQLPLRDLLDRYAVVAGHFTFAELSDDVLEDTFVLTFLREPIDRAVSLYYFYREQPARPTNDARVATTQQLDLPRFVDTLDDRISPWSNWQTYVFSGATDCERPARELLPFALRNLDRVDFVGVQNDLARGVELLAEIRDWRIAMPHDRVNATKHRQAVSEIPRSTVARLQTLNHCDAQLYARACERWRATRWRPSFSRDVGRQCSASSVHAERRETGTREILVTAVTADADAGVIIVRARSYIAASNVTVGIRITNVVGVEMYGINTHLLGLRLSVECGEEFEVAFRIERALNAGVYQVTAAVHQGSDHIVKNYHWIDNAASFACRRAGDAAFSGLIDLRGTASVHRLSRQAERKCIAPYVRASKP